MKRWVKVYIIGCFLFAFIGGIAVSLLPGAR
jgi:hypothetical protein